MPWQCAVALEFSAQDTGCPNGQIVKMVISGQWESNKN
jgi:hypothetical protein